MDWTGCNERTEGSGADVRTDKEGNEEWGISASRGRAGGLGEWIVCIVIF